MPYKYQINKKSEDTQDDDMTSPDTWDETNRTKQLLRTTILV